MQMSQLQNRKHGTNGLTPSPKFGRTKIWTSSCEQQTQRYAKEAPECQDITVTKKALDICDKCFGLGQNCPTSYYSMVKGRATQTRGSLAKVLGSVGQANQTG